MGNIRSFIPIFVVVGIIFCALTVFIRVYMNRNAGVEEFRNSQLLFSEEMKQVLSKSSNSEDYATTIKNYIEADPRRIAMSFSNDSGETLYLLSKRNTLVETISSNPTLKNIDQNLIFIPENFYTLRGEVYSILGAYEPVNNVLFLTYVRDAILLAAAVLCLACLYYFVSIIRTANQYYSKNKTNQENQSSPIAPSNPAMQQNSFHSIPSEENSIHTSAKISQLQEFQNRHSAPEESSNEDNPVVMAEENYQSRTTSEATPSSNFEVENNKQGPIEKDNAYQTTDSTRAETPREWEKVESHSQDDYAESGNTSGLNLPVFSPTRKNKEEKKIEPHLPEEVLEKANLKSEIPSQEPLTHPSTIKSKDDALALLEVELYRTIQTQVDLIIMHVETSNDAKNNIHSLTELLQDVPPNKNLFCQYDRAVLILLPNMSVHDAQEHAEHLAENIKDTYDIDTTFAITQVSGRTVSPAEILQETEEIAAIAKQKQRNVLAFLPDKEKYHKLKDGPEEKENIPVGIPSPDTAIEITKNLMD